QVSVIHFHGPGVAASDAALSSAYRSVITLSLFLAQPLDLCRRLRHDSALVADGVAAVEQGAKLAQRLEISYGPLVHGLSFRPHVITWYAATPNTPMCWACDRRSTSFWCC